MERHFGEFCTHFAAYGRKNAKLRDRGNTLDVFSKTYRHLYLPRVTLVLWSVYVPFRQWYPISFNDSLIWRVKIWFEGPPKRPNKYDPLQLVSPACKMCVRFESFYFKIDSLHWMFMKMSSAGDDIAGAIRNYSENESHNHTTQAALSAFTENFSAVQDYRNAEVSKVKLQWHVLYHDNFIFCTFFVITLYFRWEDWRTESSDLWRHMEMHVNMQR